MHKTDLNLANGYRLRSLCTDDFKLVERLCEKCSDYFILHDGVLASAEDINRLFTDLPPNKLIVDKYFLGVFASDYKLVGIVDLVRDFPTIGEWMLGLMLIAPDERGIGLGKVVHQALREWAISQGAKSFRIGVIQENEKGIKFWSGLGYKEIKEVDMDFRTMAHKVYVMNLQFLEL